MTRPPTDPVTPETLAVVKALREHHQALSTLLDSGSVDTPGCSPAIVRVLLRAINRLVLLDTRLESLKRRKPDAPRPATAADTPDNP